MKCFPVSSYHFQLKSVNTYCHKRDPSVVHQTKNKICFFSITSPSHPFFILCLSFFLSPFLSLSFFLSLLKIYFFLFIFSTHMTAYSLYHYCYSQHLPISHSLYISFYRSLSLSVFISTYLPFLYFLVYLAVSCTYLPT